MRNTYKTSLNQIPALVKKHKHELFGHILNFGCGCGWEKVKEYLETNSNRFVTSYDKYSDEESINELYQTLRYDNVVCANVLNVVETREEMKEMLDDMIHVVGDPIYYFSVYEGDRSGKGCVTSKGYQRNERAVEYEAILKEYFTTVNRHGTIFICES